MNGVYLAFFTGEYGTSLGIFLIKDGMIVGGDVGGGQYDGNYEIDGNKAAGAVTFRTSEAGYGITGAQNDSPVMFETLISLKTPIEEMDYHQIETISGPVNVRFKKIRDL